MIRVAAFLAVSLVSCDGCVVAVVDHTHRGIENLPCDDTCGKSACLSAHDVDNRSKVGCDNPAADTCICTAQ